MQYVKLGKLPNDIPRDPRHAYISKGWKNWGDWLGTGNLSPSVKHKQYKSFTEARKLVHKLKLKIMPNGENIINLIIDQAIFRHIPI